MAWRGSGLDLKVKNFKPLAASKVTLPARQTIVFHEYSAARAVRINISARPRVPESADDPDMTCVPRPGWANNNRSWDDISLLQAHVIPVEDLRHPVRTETAADRLADRELSDLVHRPRTGQMAIFRSWNVMRCEAAGLCFGRIEDARSSLGQGNGYRIVGFRRRWGEPCVELFRNIGRHKARWKRKEARALGQHSCIGASFFYQHLFAVLGDLVDQPIVCATGLLLIDDPVRQVGVEEARDGGRKLRRSVGEGIERERSPALSLRVTFHPRRFKFLLKRLYCIGKIDRSLELVDARFLGPAQLRHEVPEVCCV